METTVLEKIKKAAEEAGMPSGCRILAAVSGGADSVCLLLALRELGYRVHAAHVEHGIRAQESLDDCAFVEKLCAQRNIPLTVKSVDAPGKAEKDSLSLEEAARILRWDALMKVAGSLDIPVIAAAHHRQDQAETVLWNLIRGSSVGGLGGIRPVRLEQGRMILRPLIECGREQIEDYLRSRGVTWRIDSTNTDLSLTRNAIRQKILPLLEELNPVAVQHIAAAASDLRKTEDWLRFQTDQAWKGVIVEEGDGRETDLTADRDALKRCPDILRSRVLRRMAAHCLGGEKDITRAHITAMERAVTGANGQKTCLPDHLEAVSEEGILRLTRKKAAAGGMKEAILPLSADGRYVFPPDNGGVCREFGAGNLPEGGEGDCVVLEISYLTWPGGEVPKKKYTKYLAYDTMAPCPVLRTRREGDYLIINSDAGKKKLKDYLIDEKVPRARRDELLLVAQGSHVLWVIGMRISEGAKVSAHSKAVRITVLQDEPIQASPRL